MIVIFNETDWLYDFFFKNGMFFKYFSVLLHANYIDKTGFDNKMVWICKCLAPTSR